MEYNFQEIEASWRAFWAKHKTFKTEEVTDKPKYYVLDMFPYPSGAGLHVGHPLGYIASDIYARYKRLQGFNVLHPMGYDSFGLPAEQYAIQTGQHPRITTEENVARYREQLDKIGFSFDWDREVRTSSPEYYKWTQWIFKQLFDCWYNKKTDKAERISLLIAEFEENGNKAVHAEHDFEGVFSASEWGAMSAKEQQKVLMSYRLTYLADSWVNWCAELGTVLANDEVVNGLSERGGHPVEQKLMRQWSMRIKAYAERLLTGLDTIDWTDSIKDMQRNWIGKSQGASVKFDVVDSDKKIEVFTTRPDTIYGVSFMVLAPEHPYVDEITTKEYKAGVEEYKHNASLKSERDRQADVKNISGQFTGGYALHPFTGDKVQIWIGDYVLASYGTGAVMAVPCGDQRDWDFAKHFDIEIKNIFKDIDISEAAYTEKDSVIANSDFLNDLPAKKAIKRAIHEIQQRGIGEGQTNYRLRDAVFSRQRYWGEPFPISYKDEVPQLVSDENLPVTLPEVDKYLPTEDGEPPLARAEDDAWNYFEGDRMEYNTMPGWAGSSWYFLRYMDPKNEDEFVAKEKVDYWQNVDLYIGGAEHATGHLLYARFWTKFLNDLDYIPFNEPFQKMINQGMILGKSAIAFIGKEDGKLYSYDLIKKGEDSNYRQVKILIDLVNDDESIALNELRKWQPQFESIDLVKNEEGKIIVKREVDKMSKRWYNVVNPDVLCERYGADTLRMYEMFLGPLEQSKPWDTKGINGVHNFLRKLWRLMHDKDGNVALSEEAPSKDALKTLHKTIKKIGDDLERFSFNTGVSNFMICVNELTDQKCNNKAIIKDLVVLLSPYAPHISEELWVKLGNEPGTVGIAKFPVFNKEHLVEANFGYPVSFNGKMRFKLELPTNLSKDDIEKEVLANEQAQKWLEGKAPKKVIVVPGKIVNIVI
ncbi:MAG: leucine--tRNA ligase [Crocinitomicaceae bacterium]|nr:leucine--tRNA ligase [Crocinitomicaceae bacterium]